LDEKELVTEQEKMKMKMRINKYTRIVVFLFLGVLAIIPLELKAQEYNRLLRLKGTWKFSIGDRQEWSLKDYNDTSWDDVYVPSTWEDEGFYGYDGYAWYRKSFTISEKDKNKKLVLRLGMIDDVDEVYLNGVAIGKTGSFPPNFITAWQVERNYIIPQEFLDFKRENILAVRVYDHEYGGGIYSGEVGIYELEYGVDILSVLEGKWKFKTGDNLDWKAPALNDGSWKTVNVPSRWEFNGYPDYDGFAWYRKSFKWTSKTNDKYVVVMLGKIDDIDETYLNGELIGSTGDMISDPLVGINNDDYQHIRGYLISLDKLKKDNVLAVRVYDRGGEGGIYEGPIGILALDDYKDYLQKGKRKGKFFLGF